MGDAVAGIVEYARVLRASPLSWRSWTSGRRRPPWRESLAATAGCCPVSATARSRLASFPGALAGSGQVCQVNPAFSSVIGRVKFMERYGLSVHQAAALVLARRLLGCSERIPRRRVCPVGNGVHVAFSVAFSVPARKRVKHVWTCWGAVLGQLRPALAAQHRLGKRKRRPNPARAALRTVVRGSA